TQADPGRSFEIAANAVLRDPSVLQAERGEELVSAGVVATGRLFIDDQIQPGETLSRDLSIALPRGESPLVLQWLVPTLTRKPVSGSGKPLLFAGQRLSWGYNKENDVLYPVLCNNSAAGVNCQARDVGLIQNEIKAFDPKSVVFSKTLLIND
ncbi:MAG: hypothetical protein ACKOPS_11010, partial [Cyanobium sp.]